MKSNKFNKKRGSLEISVLTLVILIFVLIMFCIYVLYIQINCYIYPIKQDLFYIVQNSYFSLDKSNLKYYNYVIDETDMYYNIQNILTLNYNGKVNLNSISYDEGTNYVNISVEVRVTPLVLSDIIGDKFTLIIQDRIKLKMMEVV